MRRWKLREVRDNGTGSLKASEIGFKAKSKFRPCNGNHYATLCYKRLTRLQILNSSLALNYFATPLLKESF